MKSNMSRLDRFRVEVLNNIMLHDITLTATDENGERPVVVALDEEPIAVMLHRIANVGGNATVFSRSVSGPVRVVTFANVADALDPGAGEDMASRGQQPSATASVGAFLDYARLRPEGVRVAVSPGPDPIRSEATDVQDGVFA